MQFSHSGTMLASASKDTTALVWRVDSLGEPILMHTLAGHEKAVAFLTWSPDDSRILTCGADNEVGTCHIHRTRSAQAGVDGLRCHAKQASVYSCSGSVHFLQFDVPGTMNRFLITGHR